VASASLAASTPPPVDVPLTEADAAAFTAAAAAAAAAAAIAITPLTPPTTAATASVACLGAGGGAAEWSSSGNISSKILSLALKACGGGGGRRRGRGGDVGDVGVFVSARACVCERERMCVGMCVFVRVCLCVCERERARFVDGSERGWVSLHTRNDNRPPPLLVYVSQRT
jgi:hypothetical protein